MTGRKTAHLGVLGLRTNGMLCYAGAERDASLFSDYFFSPLSYKPKGMADCSTRLQELSKQRRGLRQHFCTDSNWPVRDTAWMLTFSLTNHRMLMPQLRDLRDRIRPSKTDNGDGQYEQC